MLQSNDTPLNILCSYAFLGKNKAFAEKFFSLHRQGVINGMVDSGAFTKHNAQGEYKHVNIDSYCEWLQEYGNDCEKYVMLDVIGKARESRENYETMVARGLSPMYVLTMYDNDWGYLNNTLRVNRNVCVAGGVTTKGDWLKQRFQRVQKYCNNNALIHGLGYVIFPQMYQLPLTSVDSSSWIAGCRYGIIFWFDDKGFHGAHRMDVLRGRKKLPKEFIRLLSQWKITPTEFQKAENWKSNNSIAMLASTMANLEYQKYSYRHGLRLFLAVCNIRQLDLLLFVSQNYKTITYEEFRKTV